MKSHRRQFLSAAAGSSAFLSLSSLSPALWQQAVAQSDRKQGDNKPAERILVVIQLSGGNDGLNTVVPIGDDEYQKNRPTLAIARGNVLRLDDQCGLHPSLSGLMELYESSRLAIVQGVGYPNPNRSHFESMDIWHTARRQPADRETGWLGRYIDRMQAGSQTTDVTGMHFGSEKQPLALAAESAAVPSVRSLDRFRLRPANVEPAFRQLVERNVDAERSSNNPLLAHVQTTAAAALTTTRLVEEAARNYKTSVPYPDSALAAKLKTIAQLIDANLQTRVYYVAIDGFDTHSSQSATHAGLLKQFGDATRAFVEDLAEHGHADRAVVFCFSEFGRRVRENASQGTDHGAAAPVFLAGNRVVPGLIGPRPSLTDLVDGDLKFHTDFRCIYATLLQDWLGTASEPILGNEFKTLKLLNV